MLLKHQDFREKLSLPGQWRGLDAASDKCKERASGTSSRGHSHSTWAALGLPLTISLSARHT